MAASTSSSQLKKFYVPSPEELEKADIDTVKVRSYFKSKTQSSNDLLETQNITGDSIISCQDEKNVSGSLEVREDSMIQNVDTKVSDWSGDEMGPPKSFSEAFDKLKNSKFYEEPKVLAASSAVNKVTKSNSIIVSPRQKGNPVLKYIRNVTWEFGDIIPDYVVGKSTCALFISLRYHNLNPNYIHERLKDLGRSYDLRLLLVQVDALNPHPTLKDLAKIAILADCTLVLAWSAEEAGRYLETYKMYENKPADAIMERGEGDYFSKLTDCLTAVKSINRTDAMTLISNFKSVSKIMQVTPDELELCPGFGPQKYLRQANVSNGLQCLKYSSDWMQLPS